MPVPTLLECKGNVWDGNPATVLVCTGTVYHRVWIVSERNVTRLAMKPSFLWRRIWLRCLPSVTFVLGRNRRRFKSGMWLFLSKFSLPLTASAFLLFYLFLFRSLLRLISLFLLRENRYKILIIKLIIVTEVARYFYDVR